MLHKKWIHLEQSVSWKGHLNNIHSNTHSTSWTVVLPQLRPHHPSCYTTQTTRIHVRSVEKNLTLWHTASWIKLMSTHSPWQEWLSATHIPFCNRRTWTHALQPPHRQTCRKHIQTDMYILTCLMQYLMSLTKQKWKLIIYFFLGVFLTSGHLPTVLQLCSISVIADMDDCTQMRPSLFSLVANTALALYK